MEILTKNMLEEILRKILKKRKDKTRNNTHIKVVTSK